MPNVTLIAHTPDPVRTVAAAAKLCYSKSDVPTLLDNLTEEKSEDFVKMLAAIGHESPIEHASFTFAIEGVSRAFLAQITRHRIASYSVQSQRYVDKAGFEAIVPPEIAGCPEAVGEFERCMRQCEESYEKISAALTEQHTARLMAQGMPVDEAARKAKKQAQEDARFVLPNACDTRMIVTMNARSLKNFFRERCCNRAQWEIRAVAEEMVRLCMQAAPVLFEDVGPPCVRGACPEGKMSCGEQRAVREKYEQMRAPRAAAPEKQSLSIGISNCAEPDRKAVCGE